MPLYEYVCEKCDHPFEKLTRTGEKVECPECGAAKVSRQLSLPAKTSTESAPSGAACNSVGPPCGSMCRRFPS